MLNRVSPYADWPLRLAMAGVFLFHGFKKLDGGVSNFGDAMGLNETVAAFVVMGEIFIGLAILYGGMNLPGASFFTRAAGLSTIIIMVGAIEKAHWFQWDFAATDEFPMGGMEFQVTLMAVGLWFLLTGGRAHTGSTLVDTYAHWIPRLAFAAVFLLHGLGKFDDLEGFAKMMDLPEFLSFIVAYVEMAAGILIIVSGANTPISPWVTRMTGALIVPVMLGAIALNHAGQWNFGSTEAYPMGGMEFQVLLISLGAFFIIRGQPTPELAPSGQTAPVGVEA